MALGEFGNKMKIGEFDLDKDVLVVAEIGNNHEGSYTLAEEMVGQAAQIGADAVKFQTFQAELLVGRSNKARFEQLKSYELTFDQFERLSKVAEDAGLIFLSTPFDLPSAEFLNGVVPAFKIASGDNTFYPLIEKIASTGKPIIMSTGLSTLEQIVSVKEFIEEIWRRGRIRQEMAILHCVACYPVPSDQANLRAIERLKDELDCTVGYSDHTIGIEAAVLSVALGAQIVEKHFTINKNYSVFRDHQLSADPAEMATLVRRIRDAREYMGSADKIIQQAEEENVAQLRRSIVAGKDLEEGAVLSWDDLAWVRPAGGLAAGCERQLLNKTLSRNIRRGEIITIEDVYESVRA